ncbi:MAG: TIGR00300 family protein [Halobacteriota archaeon]|jgi:lysine-ketoglutarate reductase/saccharopine dehydrogenase-like protein (TIGR00300 family)
MTTIREVELQGHIIDSLTLTRVLDKIMDLDGEFEIITFKIGAHKSDPSYVRLAVKGRDEAHLDAIMSDLHRLGAQVPEIEDVRLGAADKDKAVPGGFYSTTNHPTFVHQNGAWIPVEDIEMDCMIVVRDDRAVCTPLHHVMAGDLVVLGQRGVRVMPPERPRTRSLFEFMGGAVSSERPSATLIHKIAVEMVNAKVQGKKIAVVAGPAVSHTGAAEALSRIVHRGYVDALLAGNALAVHDIERDLYGTSLGLNIKTAELVSEGHKNHLYAISEVVRCGSITAAVRQGLVKSGIMFESVVNDVPFVLAGSIRDDGPLPDVITDIMAAQDAMRDLLKGVDLVLMMATMLHSIAVGNMLPSYVKTICVDINPATVTKLIDRGTAQAIGVVTDVGTFLPALASELEMIDVE